MAAEMRLNCEALYTDVSEEFCIPCEPEAGDTVTIRFRTARGDADGVFYIEEGKDKDFVMKQAASDRLFDYYEHRITMPKRLLSYRFRVEKNGKSWYYNRLGVEAFADDRNHDFQITPGFHTPDWAKGAVMYQIFVDRFYNGDLSNDVEDEEYLYLGRPVQKVKDWFQYPSELDVGCFYGGDLRGVGEKLDYLQDLGVEVIYFNPLFVSPSNHKYDTQDYDHIDPHYGKIVWDGGQSCGGSNETADKYVLRTTHTRNLEASDRLFQRLVEEIHRRGMRVIIDGVFNHCGSFNKWMDREGFYRRNGRYEAGAYESGESPFRSYFKFQNEQAWPRNGSYEGWWGFHTLPKLNYEASQELYDYMLGIARKWVSPPYCADGWRLDVAADLGHDKDTNHRFWQDFRREVKEANPDALILAEHYGDCSPWLMGDQWDTIMNYDAFMEPLTWFLTGMEKHSDAYDCALYGDGEEFFRSMFRNMSRMQMPSLLTSMNELSNHDHSRFLTRTNRTVGRIKTMGPEAAERGVNLGVLREAVLVQMTWPGAPTIYYGDEAGLCGWTDPDNRRTYPWGRENQELIEYHRYMIDIHKKNPALRRGALKRLLADWQLISYGRFLGGNRCVVAVNNSSEPRDIRIPVWQLGITDTDTLTRVMLTGERGYNVGMLDYPVQDGFVNLRLMGTSGILLVSNVGARK